MKKYYLGTCFVALIFLMFSLWRMSELALWGHHTLVYFLSLWLLLNALVAWAKKYDVADLQIMALTWAGAMALTVGFPPYPLVGACFVGFAFFFIHRHRARLLDLSRYRYNWQLFSGLWLWNILTTFWVENTLFISGLLANVLNALLMMIPFVLWNRIERYIPSKWFRYTAFMAFWISYEYLHLNWEISWPWLILGHQFAHVPQIIQWYEFSGVLGGTLWVLMINFLLYEWWTNRPGTKKWNLVFAGVLLVVPVMYSLIRFYTYQPRGEKAEVAVIQPNYNPHYAKETVTQEKQLEKHLRLTDSILTDSTRWLLLPESSFRGINMNNPNTHPAINQYQRLMRQRPQTATIMGVSAIERWMRQKPKDTHALREYERDNGNKFWWKAYNAAIFIKGDERPQNYKKSKFVPGAEITPYPEIFFFIKPLTDAFGGSFEGLGIQRERTAFKNGSLSMSPVICYESVYGEYSSRYVSQGKAQALGIITIDGWWGETAGHLQHLYLGALRAIELRRDIARSAVTGISGFIDQRGVVWKRSEYEETAALREEIYFNDSRTFYSIWGDMIGRLSVFFMVLSLIYALRNFLMERNG